MSAWRASHMNLGILPWRGAQQAVGTLRDIGVDPYGIEAMLPKMMHLNILLRSMPCKVANIIKQEMLSVGGDAAVARGTVACSIESTDVLLMGTRKQLDRFIEKASFQPFGLATLAAALKSLLENISTKSRILKTNRRELSLGGRTLIMAIINTTPDSFSDGGQYDSPGKAVAAGIRMEQEGADILDIGGESSRPGAVRVSLKEEMRRVIPVIEGLNGRVAVPLSVDTTKAAVAKAAIAAGAEIVNDISSMRFDAKMSKVVASAEAAVVFMHMRGSPETMQQGDLHYASLTGEIIDFFRERMQAAHNAGIETDRIVIDPGIGFGKSKADNFRLLKHLAEFAVLGRPVLTGPSRKSFLAHEGEQGPLDRLEATGAAITAAVMNGCHIVRVHDVTAARRVAAIADAVVSA